MTIENGLTMCYIWFVVINCILKGEVSMKKMGEEELRTVDGGKGWYSSYRYCCNLASGNCCKKYKNSSKGWKNGKAKFTYYTAYDYAVKYYGLSNCYYSCHAKDVANY